MIIEVSDVRRTSGMRMQTRAYILQVRRSCVLAATREEDEVRAVLSTTGLTCDAQLLRGMLCASALIKKYICRGSSVRKHSEPSVCEHARKRAFVG